MKHSLERTNAKGQPFVGTCALCGKQNLTMADMARDECENPRGLSEDDAVIEAIGGVPSN